MESINGQSDEINASLDYEEDLAETVNTIDEEQPESVENLAPSSNVVQPEAYEGNEYSYI